MTEQQTTQTPEQQTQVETAQPIVDTTNPQQEAVATTDTDKIPAAAGTNTEVPDTTQETPAPLPAFQLKPPTPTTTADPFADLTPEIVAQRLNEDQKKALLSQLGYDEYVQKIADFYKSTGSIAEVTKELSTDWKSLSVEQSLTEMLREQYVKDGYPADKVQKLVDRDLRIKYRLNENLDDFDGSEREDIEIAQLQAEMQANKYREQRIARQQQLQPPARPQEQPATPAVTHEQIVEQQWKAVSTQPEVQQFLQRKQVQFGTETPFTFESATPQETLAIIYDPNRYTHAMSKKDQNGNVLFDANNQPVMDYGRMLKVATYIQYMDNIENGLVNHGRTLGKKAIQDEAENVQDNRTHVPGQPSLLDVLKAKLTQGR